MIVTHGLTKRYGKTVAVDNLSCAVSPGVVTGFLGPNGSGKSTTMRMILGLDVPDAGTAIAVFAGFTLLAPILLQSISESISRYAPELIFANSVADVVPQSEAVSVTIGVVVMVLYCALSLGLGLGAILLNRQDA